MAQGWESVQERGGDSVYEGMSYAGNDWKSAGTTVYDLGWRAAERGLERLAGSCRTLDAYTGTGTLSWGSLEACVYQGCFQK